MKPVPADGETMGEIMFRGNITMKGYLKNPKATREAFAGGWFHSGDLAVMHPDGYVKIKDRSKDIIISGGENISSLEVEDVLYRHPAVMAAAVVARPDDEMGRDAVRVRGTQARRQGHRARRADRVLPRPDGRSSRRRAPWCSASCPRPRPARSRSSCCAKRRNRPPPSIHEKRFSAASHRAARPAARGPRRRLHAHHESAAADEPADERDAVCASEASSTP